MPGLSFLSKKSWHTSNIDNVERVWLAEQKAEAEKKKLDELQKQLNEERQIQELRQLQVQSGQKVKTVDTSLDWMYQGPSADIQKQQSSEEFLLGKIFKPKEEVKLDFNKGESSSNTEWMNKVANKNDAFTRVHEDPILRIKQEEKRKRDLVMNNPIKMDSIRSKIAAELKQADEEKRLKKEAKRAKKDAKKESKKDSKKESKKSHRRERSESSLSEGSEPPLRRGRDEEGSRSPERKVRRSRSPEEERRAPRDTRREARSRSRSRDRRDVRDSRRDDSRDRRDGRDRRDSRDRRDVRRDDGRDRQHRDRDRDDSRLHRDGSDRDRRRDDSRSRVPEPHRGGRADSRGRDLAKQAQGAAATTSSSSSSSSKPDAASAGERARRESFDSEGAARREEEPRYGLISKSSRPAKPSSSDGSLGPSAALLQKKADKDRAEQEARNRKRVDVSQLSEQERLRRIAAMQEDAERHDSTRSSRQLVGTNGSEEGGENTGNAAFLESMRRSVYTSSAADMQERLSSNRHYMQSSANLEHDNGFRKN